MLKMTTESKIFSQVYKFNPMESTWQKFFIEEFFNKLLLMISFLWMPKMNLFLQKHQAGMKFGSLFCKNVGLNFIKTTLLFLEVFLIKSYTLFQEHQLYSIIFQLKRLNKINCLKLFIMHIKMLQFCVVEPSLIF